MFLLLEVAGESWILGFVPEQLEILIFGMVLISLTIGLRWILKRSEKNAKSKIEHITEQN
jgi:hypothetical protein